MMMYTTITMIDGLLTTGTMLEGVVSATALALGCWATAATAGKRHSSRSLFLVSLYRLLTFFEALGTFFEGFSILPEVVFELVPVVSVAQNTSDLKEVVYMACECSEVSTREPVGSQSLTCARSR